MKNILQTVLVALCACSLPVQAANTIPHLARQGDAVQLHVNGKPFLMIGGELNNSNSSTKEYAEPLMRTLQQMNVNTVLAAVNWEQIEPEEGVYDFTQIDDLIELSRKYNLKLVPLWFASWKNGRSSYPPLWLKRDTKRFQRAMTADGQRFETLSPFCEESMKADARAYAALMKHIKKVDHDHTVIMMQVQNEPGLWNMDMDYSPPAQKAFHGPVPQALIDYMTANPDPRSPVQQSWEAQGRPKSGTWVEVFGDNVWTREYCIAWAMASYIEYGTRAGQAEYNLPMFVNAWLVQSDKQVPGDYPNGGPVSRVMDIYKAAAPSIFALAPDIYLKNFKEICHDYVRQGNPLLIPEARVNAGQAFWSFAEMNALCFSPYFIEERALGDFAFQGAYGVLEELQHMILKYQGTGKMRGILKEGKERNHSVVMGDYVIHCEFVKRDEPAYGLIIQTAEDEFLISGINMNVAFSSNIPGKVGMIGQAWEGRYEKDGTWRVTRFFNGNETYSHQRVRVWGRKSVVSYKAFEGEMGPSPEQSLLQGDHTDKFGGARDVATVAVPGIYKVKTYTRD